jgi:hypothetical protein
MEKHAETPVNVQVKCFLLVTGFQQEFEGQISNFPVVKIFKNACLLVVVGLVHAYK